MTAKEKAVELVDKFTFNCRECDNGKLSALIAVDEILHFMDVFDLDIEIKHQHKWWQLVKQEIEKL